MTPENPAHKVLISATQRTWGDFRDTEEMEQTKKDMKKMRRELHDSKSDTDVKKKKIQILNVMIRGLKKIISMKRRTINQCFLLTAVTLGLLGAIVSSPMVKNHIDDFHLRMAENPDSIHEYTAADASLAPLPANSAVRCFFMSDSEREIDGHTAAITTLTLKFPGEKNIFLKSRLSEEEGMFQKAAGIILQKYGFPEKGIEHVSDTIVLKLSRFNKRRIAGEVNGVIGMTMTEIIADSIGRVEKRLRITSPALAKNTEAKVISGGGSERKNEGEHLSSSQTQTREKKTIDELATLRVLETKVKKLLDARKIADSDNKSKRYAEAIYRAHRNYGISPFLLAGIMERESGGDERAVSSTKQGYGLMQVNWRVHRKWVPGTFKNIQTENDMMVPENNILLGAAIYKGGLKRSRGDHRRALMAYLGGESDSYARFILRSAEAMERDKKIVVKILRTEIEKSIGETQTNGTAMAIANTGQTL
jgi:hypothetical protein